MHDAPLNRRNDDRITWADDGCVGFQENQRVLGAFVAHVFGVLGVVHSHTHHFGARNHGGEDFCLLQWNPNLGGVEPVEQRIPA